jgi:predicted CopG family antitoxin
MPNTSIRIADDIYEHLKQEAAAQGISISDFIRNAIEQALHTVAQPTRSENIDVLQRQLAEREDEVQYLRQELSATRQNTEVQLTTKDEQLQTKDEQISELHKLVAMAQTTANELTQQLKSTSLQLEDLRQKEHRSVWKRLLGK